jgi:hypothetical protein
MTTLLLLPSLLRCKKTKKREDDGNNAGVAFFAVL